MGIGECMTSVFVRFAISLALVVPALSLSGCAKDLPIAVAEQRYMSPASQFVALSDGVRLHYRDEGPRDAPALILAHGSNASLHTWEPWVKSLSGKWRVISFDFPAHGLTGPSASGVYDGAAYVKVVDELAAHLGVTRFVLGGNSMGGAVTWRYALAHPDKLAGIILVDAAGYPRPDAKPPLVFQLARAPVLGEVFSALTSKSILAANLKQVFVNDAQVTPEMVQRYYDLLMRSGNRAATLSRLRQPIDQPEAYRAIPTIKVPTLVLWGQLDPWIPVADAARFGSEIAGAKVVTWPNVGHIPQEEVAGPSANEVDAFLTQVWAPKPDGAAPKPAP